MKILLGILGLTVGLALPLFGQEPQAVSADVRSQVEAVFVKFQDAYNARDAEGIAATMTLDAVEMRSGAGLAIGRQAVVARFLQDFKENLGPMVNTILQMYPVGPDGVCVIADSHVGTMHFQTMTLYVRSGGGWKSKMAYVRGP
jgi:ketosteroid isomerase-like protein